jgi:hypothetical protein
LLIVLWFDVKAFFAGWLVWLWPCGGNTSSRKGRAFMKTDLLRLAAVALFLLVSVGARAQGVTDGINSGVKNGDAAAGPVGAVVGGIIGGVAGGIGGLLGIDQRPAFRNYVDNQHLPSDEYRALVAVGNQLPENGIRYYDLPPRFGIRGYRYAIVNDVPVLVDPRTRKIVEVVEVNDSPAAPQPARTPPQGGSRTWPARRRRSKGG